MRGLGIPQLSTIDTTQNTYCSECVPVMPFDETIETEMVGASPLTNPIPKDGIDDDLRETPLSDALKRELTVYRRLKPFIGHCLTLNHDINNPLAGILGYAEFMLAEDDGSDEELVNNIRQIAACAERIQKRIESLCSHKLCLATGLDLESLIREYKQFEAELSDK